MPETMIYKKKLMKKAPMTNICEGCDIGKSPDCTYINCGGIVWKEVKEPNKRHPLICWLLGHKFEEWHREGGTTLATIFEYDFRRCSCGHSESKNHTEEFIK
jgi:hypothetical protein